ncbi:Uncharacterised protein [Serratia entomophila]|nr:Uncharacterised protein [Serratia entomophila]CAI1724085.1 Uncharacterised protein [Serratia entomophila]
MARFSPVNFFTDALSGPANGKKRVNNHNVTNV